MSLRSLDPNIVEAMEACRPGSDDVSQPEMAALSAQLAASPALDRAYERLQKLDGALVVAFRNVPAPEGLGDRILAAVAVDSAAASDEGCASAIDSAVASPSADEPVALASRRKASFRRTGRRVLLGAMASSAAAALIVAVVWPFLPAPATRDSEAILSLAMVFASNDRVDGVEPLSRLTAEQARQFPISPLVAHHPRIAWREIRDFLGQGQGEGRGRDGVAYDITSRAGIRARLYVVGASGEGLPSGPAAQPYPTGWSCATTWREGGVLYVLVVLGDQDAYERFLAPAQGTGPVA